MKQTILSSEINPKHRDLVNIGVKMQELAPREPDDEKSNNYAKLGNELVAYGGPFGPKSVHDILNRTGLTIDVVTDLIKHAKNSAL